MFSSGLFVLLGGFYVGQGAFGLTQGSSQVKLEYDERPLYRVSRSDQLFREVDSSSWLRLAVGPRWEEKPESLADVPALLPADHDLCFANRISSLRDYIADNATTLWVSGINLDALLYKYMIVRDGDICWNATLSHPGNVGVSLFMQKEYSQVRDSKNYHVTRKWTRQHYPSCTCVHIGVDTTFYNSTDHIQVQCDVKKASMLSEHLSSSLSTGYALRSSRQDRQDSFSSVDLDSGESGVFSASFSSGSTSGTDDGSDSISVEEYDVEDTAGDYKDQTKLGTYEAEIEVVGDDEARGSAEGGSTDERSSSTSEDDDDDEHHESVETDTTRNGQSRVVAIEGR